MSIYANLSNNMALPSSTGVPVDFDGSIFLAFGNPSFRNLRRKRNKSFREHDHLERRLFDPQLYLADLDFDECSNVCTKLASYSWFDVDVPKFDSKVMKQSEWKPSVVEEVAKQWRGIPTTDKKKIEKYVEDCIFYQREIGCQTLIAPAPTTFSTSNYAQELLWLNTARRIKRERGFSEPLFATVALATPLFSHDSAAVERCLSSIANAISARQFDGVYLIFCQSGDYGDTKHPTNENALYHILRFINLLKESDPAPSIIANGIGFFGLACRAVGADAVGVGWYRKQYRIHLADFEDTKMVLNKKGDLVSVHKAFPKYWTSKVMGDIGLPRDLDKLVSKGFLAQIKDETLACEDLLLKAGQGKSVKGVSAWIYKASVVSATREHFLRSCVKAERQLSSLNREDRLSFMSEWLSNAVALGEEITEVLRSGSTSNTNHVATWQRAFERFRTSQ